MLRIFSTPNIGPVPNNIGKIAQERQLFRSQVYITDNLSGHVVIDVYRVGLSVERGSLYNNALCGLEDALVDVLQRTLEALPRQSPRAPAILFRAWVKASLLTCTGAVFCRWVWVGTSPL